MKTTKILSLIAFLLCFSSIATAVGYSIPNNEIHYTSIDGNIVTPYKTNGFGANIVSNTYENGQGVITFERSVTSIGELAFSDCSTLTSIVLPNSVTSMGESVFQACSSLTSIDIPNSVTNIDAGAFHSCSSLTSITIPESVTSIGQAAFEHCSSLASITIPESVTSIGNRTFCGCSSLIDSINIPNGITTIGEQTFCNCSSLPSITIPNTVTSIGRSAFFGCSSLTTITIPESVTSIGQSAFEGCSSLASITISGSVTSIEYKVFYGCSSLASITIPESVTSIGLSTFEGCFSLTSITIPESVTNIGSRAFSGCVFVGKDNFINYSSLNAEENNYWGARIADKDIDGLLIRNNTIIACRPYVTSVTIPNSITSIGSAAFKYCSSLTSITIPNSIKSIGDGIFLGCYNLSSIVVESGNTTYDSRNNCNAIIHSSTGRLVAGCKNTIIPDNVTTIESYAFKECSSLTSIDIPNGVTSIGSQAFYGCSSLTSITIPESVTSIGESAFDGCSSLPSITIPQNITRIADFTFEDCSSLTSITIPESVTSIGHSAFSDCSSLTSITIPESVTSIGGWAFSGCSSLTDSINIPNGVMTIEEYTFYRCSSLTSITIPESVTSIGSGAFSYCSSLTDSINIPNGVTTIGEHTFSGCFSLPSITIPNTVTSIGRSAFLDCSSLTTIDIPNSVTTIGDYAFFGCRRLMSSISIPKGITTIGEHTFYNCSSLPSISIPNSVTSIGRKAFEYCSSLTSVSIPDSVTNIGEEAFRVCSSLTSVTIGCRVTNIGDYAFAYCNKLDTIYCNASIPPTLSNQNIFSNYNATLYVPCEALEAYKADAIWGMFSNIQCIEEPTPPCENVDTTEYATICYGETYTWNGQTYSAEGEYSITLSTANGCDSIVTLHLTILPEAIIMEESAAINEEHLPYLWRGQQCYDAGKYIDSEPFTNYPYCDSVIYVLNLTVEAPNKCGENLYWHYSNNTLSITGSGAMYDDPDLLSYRNQPWYPERVNHVVLPDAITHIGNVAFADCANLTNIDIPSSVTSIGDGSFSWTGLQSVIIPASVTDLGEQVFETCNNLHTILYEGTPSSISNQTVHPFIGCVHLDTIITPAALWHCTTADPMLEARYGVPHKARYIEVTDGELTKQAMKYIAKNSGTVEVLDLSAATNTTLPLGALLNNYRLSTLYLPEQIEVIPEMLAEGCHSLAEILIPATVTEIGNYAFAGCTNVWRMTVEAVLPPKVYDKTFDGIDRSISLIVPAGSEELYRQAEYWKEFFIENTNNQSPKSNCQKILHEDHILILREGKVYTTMGQLVK